MTRGRLVVHAHFYQPLRADPFTGRIPREPAASPFHDWNERINEECYRANAQRGNHGHISWDLGPTLASWLKVADLATYEAFVAADVPETAGATADGAGDTAGNTAGGGGPTTAGDPAGGGGPTTAQPLRRPTRRATDVPDAAAAVHGNAMAQPFHHAILPLASLADRRTEVRWGIRSFELRHGRRPDGMWLPETAVDLPTLRILAEHGIRYTILAPWQAADSSLDTRRLYRVELGGGRSMGVAFYDGMLSGAVSFDPTATADADAFIRDRLIPRFGMPAAEQEALRGAATAAGRSRPRPGARAHGHDADRALSPVVVIASDGELYGHHQTFRDLFLHRLVVGPNGEPATPPADRGFDVVMLSQLFAEAAPDELPVARIAERTSWSCHHGVARWSAECPDARDGRWKAPLRAALERLATAIDTVTAEVLRHEARSVDPLDARDAYVDVVSDGVAREAFAARWLGRRARAASADRFLDLMEGQRWRLAMFQSDAWYWDDPVRFETKQVLRAAARAVRLVDDVAGSRLEDAFCDDLTLFTSPSRGFDGFAIYREALAEVAQPAP